MTDMQETIAISVTHGDVELIRQWFDSVQDINPGYLDTADFVLAKRIYELTDMRTPHSVLRGANGKHEGQDEM